MVLPTARLWSTSEPAAVPAHVAAATSEVRGWADPAASRMSATERARWLLGLRELIDAAEVTFTRVLSAFDAHGDAQTLSAASSTVSWLRHELSVAPADASARVRLSRDRDLLREPMAAVCSGELRFDHLRAISAALRPLRHDPEHATEAVPLLHELATRADPATVRAAGRHLREVVDPDGALREQDQQFERRRLSLSPLLDGMTAVEGLLDAESTATLTAALAPLMVSAGPADVRHTEQRRADALVELAAVALRSEQLPQLSGAVAALDVVVPWSVLAGRHESPSHQQRGGAAAATHVTAPEGPSGARYRGPLDALPVVRVLDHPGGPATVTEQELRRLACDCRVGRVVLGPDSTPLDVGRRVRLFTADQRRALTVRDGGCRFPGCTRPPRFTDAHHLVSWLDGGGTDVANGLLLCRWHHGRVHRTPDRNGWTITPVDTARGTNGRLEFRGPAGRVLLSDPRGP